MAERDRPNIVYILADDMGYGDVRCLNPDSAFSTPNLDRIGQGGMVFRDAHSSSAVCTPSRYSILTGRYCWRTYLKRGVLFGMDQALIEPERETVGSMLKQHGYDTACIGKWHLGWDWAVKPGMEDQVNRHAKGWDDCAWIDFERPIQNGPTTKGFDTFYGIAGSLDMPPYVYVQDDRPVETPTAWGSDREFLRAGPRMESLRANNVLSTITGRAVDYIESSDGEKPFFLYMPLTAPHTPIAPAPEFDGASGVNPYADFCMEVDARVGQVLDAIDRKGLTENTLVIYTTDNGAAAEHAEAAFLEARYGHRCSHVYRGFKSDIWDGGHRLPFLVRWPAVVAEGGYCDAPVGLFDLFATAADIVGYAIPDAAAEDSVSFLPALRDGSAPSGPGSRSRDALIHHSIDGRFGIRVGDWKLCRCPGSGGWSLKDDVARAAQMLPVQLYNLAEDPGETTNLAKLEPGRVAELTEALHRAVIRGRTTPGAVQPNAAAVPLDAWRQVDWLPEIPAAFVLDD